MNIIEKMIKYINKTQKDHILHQYVSYVIYMICFGLLLNLTNYYDVIIVLSSVITIGIGMFKEYVIDYRWRRQKMDKQDFINDLIGTGLAVLTSLLLV